MAQASSVSALTAALGVKTFLEVPPSSYNAYTALPFATIDNDLKYLGVHLIREATYNTQTAGTTLVAEFTTLINEGYKFDLGADSNAANMANLDQFATLHPGALQSVEGPNEINYFPFSYDGKTGELAATEFQANAYNAVKQDPLLAGVKVLDFTGGGTFLGTGQPYQTLPGNADLANVHLYPANGDPPAWYVSAIYDAQYGASITAPFAVTEAGYDSDPNTPNGVSLDVQAKQTLSLVLDAAQSGAASIYLYQLLDQYADPGNTDPDNHWGLFNSDGSPKPVATALHNLTSILADPGISTGNSMIPLGSASYSSPNMPWGTHSWLLEKSNGVFDLILWAEPKIWDPATRTEISVASTPVTIDLGRSYQSIKLFDPLSGSDANANYTDSQTVTIPISDHAVILEFGSSPVMSAVTVQPLSPALPMLAPASDSGIPNDHITNVATPTITGFAEAGSTVRLYDTDGTTVLGTAVADAGGDYWIVSSRLSDGGHALTLRTTDAAGNASSASLPLAVTIDTTLPALSAPFLSAGSDSGAIGDGITNVAAPTLMGMAEAGSTVRIYDTGGALVVSAVATPGGTYAIACAPLADGVHVLITTATDAAGNVGTAIANLILTIDTQAPAAPLAASLTIPSDSGTIGDGLTSTASPTMTGMAENGSTVRLYDSNGTTVLGSAVADATGRYFIASSPLPDGTHTLTIRATDAAGNVGEASAALALTIDTATPGAPSAPTLDAGSDSGAIGDGITNATMPTVVGSGAGANSTVRLYDTNDTTLLGTATADGSGDYLIFSSRLADGAHALHVHATDAAGIASAASPALDVIIDTQAPTAGTPTLAAGSDTGVAGDGITNVRTPTISGRSAPGATVRAYDTNDATVLGTAVADQNNNYVMTLTAMTEGAHVITVMATDAAGNAGARSGVLKLTIDTSTPATAISGIEIANTTTVGGTLTTTTAATQMVTATLDAALLPGELLLGSSDGGATLANLTSFLSGTSLSWGTASLSGSSSIMLEVVNAAGTTGKVAVQAYVATPSMVVGPPVVIMPPEVVTLPDVGSPAPIGNTPAGPARTPAGDPPTDTGNTPVAMSTINPPTPAGAGTTYRFFDSIHGTQFITASATERDQLIATRPDLAYEGKGMGTVAANSSDPNVAQVFRFFSKADGTHFFTTNAGERDTTIATRSDLTYEGTGFNEHVAAQPSDTAVYRFFNSTNGSHFFTSSESERASLTGSRPDMINEGIAFYAPYT